MTKSLLKAYLCWFIGGLFGLHHFYLKRNTQAIICLYTFGGFLIGLIYDAYRMPDYVREANQDSDFIEDLEHEMNQSEGPSLCITSFINCLVSGTFFYYFIMNFIKHDREVNFRIHVFLELIFTLVEAQMVYFISTGFGRKCNFKYAAIGACIGLFFRLVQNGDNELYYPLFATMLCHWQMEWDKDLREKKRQREEMTTCQHWLFYTVFLVLFFILIYIYASNSGMIRADRELELDVIFYDLFHVEELGRFFEYLKFMWDFASAHGFWKLVEHLTHRSDEDGGEIDDYQVSILLFKYT